MQSMTPMQQEDLLGCGIACVAFILGKTYQQTLQLIPQGKTKVLRGFYCSELATLLTNEGHPYSFHHNKRSHKKSSFQLGTIVYIKKSNSLPAGHFLCLAQEGWMDSWINFPELKVKAGWRDILPGEPQYYIEPSLK